MQRIRVLIVDDSVVIRRLLTDILSAEPDLEVVGAAARASIALADIERKRPDVVTLDVEMPDMSGLDVLTRIRATAPKLPVIMFSSLMEKAAAATLEALARGATDYVTKPTGGGREAATEQVRTQLVPKIRALATCRPDPYEPVIGAPRSRAGITRVAPEVLAVGCSTGGPNALAELFKHIPASFPLPVVIVQHMPPLFTRILAERLTASCPLRFHEARHGDVLEPGHAWIAPGDHHMRVVQQGTRTVIAVNQDPPENSCRPAVDVLFRSVADVFGGRSLALVLTGMGQDGLKGVEHLYARGAHTIVQDEATSVVWGMPGFVARAGLAGAILPLGDIASELQRIVASPPAASPQSDRRRVS